jgi:hypothetical protein
LTLSHLATILSPEDRECRRQPAFLAASQEINQEMKLMTHKSAVPASRLHRKQPDSEGIKSERKRGPKKLEYIPPEFQGIEGIQLINTGRQLVKLAMYLSSAPAKRPAYMKLGATVIPKSSNFWQPPFSIWVVSYEGRIRVVRLDMDPRGAARQMASLREPWNLERALAPYLKPQGKGGAAASMHPTSAL